MNPDRKEPPLQPEAGRYCAVQWRRPGAAAAALGLAWAAISLAVYYRQRKLPFFSLELWLSVWPPLVDMVGKTWARHVPPLAWFFLFVVGAAVVGRRALKYFTQSFPLNILERWAYSYGLGVGIWGLLMLALSLAGLLSPPAVHLVFAVLVGGCWWLGRGSHAGEDLRTGDLWKGYSLPLGLLAVGALLLTAVSALSPDVWYDSLVYHLALPSLYKLEGAMVPAPTLVYSGFPMHMEMLYLWALIGGGPITAKLIHWSMGVGATVAMLGFFARRGTPWAGWAASAIFLSMPMTGFDFSRTMVEGGSVFFMLLAAAVVTLYLEQPETAAEDRRLPMLAAFFVGIAMSVKYLNGPVLLVFLVVLAMSRRISGKTLAWFALIASACLAPWLMKNAVFYKNPMFPFFHDWWFPATTTPVDWRGLQADALGRDWGTLVTTGGRPLWEAVASIFFMTMKIRTSADFMGVLWLVFLPALWLVKPVSAGAAAWIRIFWGVALVWFLTTSMPRLFLPGLALLAVVEGLALALITKRWLRWAAVTTVLLLGVNNLFFMTRTMSLLDMNSYLRGDTDASGYLQVPHDTYPTPDYASREWINRQTPPAARVLVLGDARGFYLERPFQTASIFDTDPFWLMVDESAGAEDLYRRLTAQGFSHLLVNIGEIIRLQRGCPAKKAGSLELAEVFFKKYTKICFGEKITAADGFRWSLVYAIVPPDGDASDNALLVDLYRSMARK